MGRPIYADALIKEIWKMRGTLQMLDNTQGADLIMHGLWMVEQKINEAPTIDAVSVVHGEWIDCKEPPSTGRNVFIAYGTDNMKSVCIGHYEHDLKLWYEDKNFFAKPIYDAMYWCEIPQFPTRMKGADDE